MEIKKKILQGWSNKKKYLAAKKSCNPPIKNQMVHPLEKQWRVGRGKKFTKRGREKEKLGKGDREGKEKLFFLPRTPPHPTFTHSRPNSPSLQQIQNGS